jgi:hypothetical protein
MPPIDPHVIFEAISACVTVAWLVVSLFIKNSLADIKLTQEKVKAELLASQVNVKEQLEMKYVESKEELQRKHVEILAAQNSIKEELSRKDHENSQSIAVHTAEDNLRFATIDRSQLDLKDTLVRIEAKIDANGRH